MFYSESDKYYALWSEFDAAHWRNDSSFLPYHLTASEKQIAQQELKAIPEVFYSRMKLPVITPDNCLHFCAHLKSHNHRPRITLWSWFSGSGTLSSVMAGSPFQKGVLFPVDLRYGWDIKDPRHQALLMKVDGLFRPMVTTKEPRCKYWSVAGFLRSEQKTQEMQPSYCTK